MIKVVGPQIVKIARQWTEALAINDTEALFELTLQVYKNPSYNTSMYVNYPKIYQQMQEVYDLEIKSMNDACPLELQGVAAERKGKRLEKL